MRKSDLKNVDEVYKWLDMFKDIPDCKEYVDSAKMYIGSFSQIEWERDLAIAQLKELGYQLGEKIHKN